MDHPTPTAREQMVAIAAQRAMYSTQPEVRTMQAMYFKQDSQRKRGPPTPNISAGTTPQDAPEAPATSSDEPALVAPTVLEADVAMQQTTGHFGVDLNDHNAVGRFLQQPVKTAEDVLRLVHGYQSQGHSPGDLWDDTSGGAGYQEHERPASLPQRES